MPMLSNELSFVKYRRLVLKQRAKEFQLLILRISEKMAPILDLDCTCLINNRTRTTVPIVMKFCRNKGRSLENTFFGCRCFGFKFFIGKFQF